MRHTFISRQTQMRKHAQPPINLRHEMPGDVYMIPDKHWGIQTNADDHPGICITYDEEKKTVFLFKGTSNSSHKYSDSCTIVSPTLKNGLDKITIFPHFPKVIRVHKVVLYYPERHIGRLEHDVFENMQYAFFMKQAMQDSKEKKCSRT